MPEPALVILVLAVPLATVLAVVRTLLGPRQADRVVGLDVLLACAVALCVAAALRSGRVLYLDVGLGLALVGFVGTMAWARLIDHTSSDGPPAEGGS